ncbi:hypothetical protein GCM10010151_69240 [Actinoallomurus spadix]|uniref:Uncharacterized protein n=1 Tax=Actinoallomurus spadix TaxID=79912 RepID=A0ABN0XPG0_9ACTN
MACDRMCSPPARGIRLLLREEGTDQDDRDITGRARPHTSSRGSRGATSSAGIPGPPPTTGSGGGSPPNDGQRC